jgi:ubiquinone biosynthesis protein UbiJ
MLERPVIGFLSMLVEREAWARERLAPFAGKYARVRLVPLPDLVIEVLEAGYIGPGHAAAEAAVTLTISPAVVPLLFVRPDAAMRDVRIEGDTELARAIEFLFRNLRWDVEEDLSRIVGDVAAHRMAGAARSLGAWQREAAERLGENVAEYLKEEAGLLVYPYEVEQFGREVEALRDAVERLEKRVERVAGTVERKKT